MASYAVPASPSCKTQPEPPVLEDVAGGDYHQNVWHNVKHQIQPLQHPFQYDQLDIALLSVFPADMSVDCQVDSNKSVSPAAALHLWDPKQYQAECCSRKHMRQHCQYALRIVHSRPLMQLPGGESASSACQMDAKWSQYRVLLLQQSCRDSAYRSGEARDRLK